MKEAAKTSGGAQEWEQEVWTAVRPGQGFSTHRHQLRSAPSCMTLAKSSQISELQVPLLINGAQSHLPTPRAMKTKGANTKKDQMLNHLISRTAPHREGLKGLPSEHVTPKSWGF